MPRKKNYCANGYVKYTKADFLSYAEAFDYTEDFLYQSEDKNGKETITYEQAIEKNKQEHEAMKKWKLTDFHAHFGFAYKDNYNGGETLSKPKKGTMATDVWL